MSNLSFNYGHVESGGSGFVSVQIKQGVQKTRHTGNHVFKSVFLVVDICLGRGYSGSASDFDLGALHLRYQFSVLVPLIAGLMELSR